jgi:hypothetical protein
MSSSIVNSDMHWLANSLKLSAEDSKGNPFAGLAEGLGNMMMNAFQIKPGWGLYALLILLGISADHACVSRAFWCDEIVMLPRSNRVETRTSALIPTKCAHWRGYSYPRDFLPSQRATHFPAGAKSPSSRF